MLMPARTVQCVVRYLLQYKYRFPLQTEGLHSSPLNNSVPSPNAKSYDALAFGGIYSLAVSLDREASPFTELLLASSKGLKRSP
jgi:hypothetical protein